MTKMTFVVEFNDGFEPTIYDGTDILWGRLSTVLWSDYRDDFFEPGEVDVVREALAEITYDDVDCECHNEIISKMEPLTK